MQYRYFDCTCGNKFYDFVEPTEVLNADNKPKVIFQTECPSCKTMIECTWNDPKAIGTKLLFNYMER